MLPRVKVKEPSAKITIGMCAAKVTRVASGAQTLANRLVFVLPKGKSDADLSKNFRAWKTELCLVVAHS